MAKRVSDQTEGALGLELMDPVAQPVGLAPADCAGQRTSLGTPMHILLGGSVPPAPGTHADAEALIQVSLDQDARAWRVEVMVLGLGGELLSEDMTDGEVHLRNNPAPDSTGVVGLGLYDLLGTALDQGLLLVGRLSLPDDCQVVVEVDTWANGVLRGSLIDWVRSGAFLPGGPPRFPYAHESWGRVATILLPSIGRPGAVVRWKH